jgi:hypothetical protein
MKRIVTISRKWHNPKIEVWLSDEEIGLKIEFDDFIMALKKEIGKIFQLIDFNEMVKKEIKSVAFVFRKSTFEKIFDEAIQKVLDRISDKNLLLEVQKNGFEEKLDIAISNVLRGIKEESTKIFKIKGGDKNGS